MKRIIRKKQQPSPNRKRHLEFGLLDLLTATVSEPYVAAGLEQRYSSRSSSTGSGLVEFTGSDERSPILVPLLRSNGSPRFKIRIRLSDCG